MLVTEKYANTSMLSVRQRTVTVAAAQFSPNNVSLKGKHYGAILAALLYHALRCEELCKLLVNDFKHSVAVLPISRFPAREERRVILKQAFGNPSKQSLSDFCCWVEAELPIKVTIRARPSLDCCGDRLASLRAYQGYSLTA